MKLQVVYNFNLVNNEATSCLLGPDTIVEGGGGVEYNLHKIIAAE